MGQDLVPALGYFLPTNETPDENDEHDEDDEDVLPIPGVVYEHIRDYNFTTGAAHKMDPMKKTKNVCFSMDESGQKVRWVDVGYTVKARRKAGMPVSLLSFASAFGKVMYADYVNRNVNTRMI